MHHRFGNYTDATRVTLHLWVGNVCAARNRAWREQHDIKYVLNVAEEWHNDVIDINSSLRESVPLRDGHVLYHPETQLFDAALLFEAASQLIRWQLHDPGARMLVHCNAGVSRSMAVALLYTLQSGYEHSFPTKRFIASLMERLYAQRHAGHINQRFFWAIDLLTHPAILAFYAREGLLCTQCPDLATAVSAY